MITVAVKPTYRYSMRAEHIIIMNKASNYYWCVEGINRNGIYSESENNGPFNSEQQALDDAWYTLTEIAKEYDEYSWCLL